MRQWPKGAVWFSAFGIAVLQVLGSFGAADNQPDRKAIDLVALMLLLIGPAALAVRDRRPLVAALVAAAAADVFIALGYPYGPIFVSVIVGLFACVQTGDRRAPPLVAGFGYVGYLVATRFDPSTEPDPGLVHLALVAGWLVVVLAVSEVVRVRRDQAAGRARAEQDEDQRRIAEQRLDLARELHDVLAHNISLINVQASVALHLLDDDPDQARPALTNIKGASRDALHELRAALDLLRHGEDAPRAPQPGLADVDALVAGVRAGGLVVRVEQRPPFPPLPAAVELAAYRIVQEALTNVTRHARAHEVVVRLGYDEGVTIEVLDDGIGGPPGPSGPAERERPGPSGPAERERPGPSNPAARKSLGPAGPAQRESPHPGNGISGMRERASALGGSAEAGPRPGGGYRVFAHLPGRQP